MGGRPFKMTPAKLHRDHCLCARHGYVRPGRDSSPEWATLVLFDTTRGVWQSDGVEIRFAQAARRHRIGRRSVLWVLTHTAATGTTTHQDSTAWGWVGLDERGRQLEVVAVEVQGDRDPEPVLLVIHVMPTHFRKDSP